VIASRQEIAPEAVARHYDELDEFYREIWGEHVHHGLWRRGDESRDLAVRQLVELVARHAQIHRHSRVCDIGCGYGATARLLACERGAEVTGVTISPAQYAIAQERTAASANTSFVLGDWLKMAVPQGAFDAAIAIESSEHMPDKAAFFTQAYRALRPGGRLVICAWLSADNPTPRQKRWLLEPICREGRMPHLGDANDYRQWAKAAGFRVGGFEEITKEVARTWPIIVRIFIGNLLRKPHYVRFLFNRHAHNRIFALTIVRLWIAFRNGAMRYGVFTFVKG
jgi:cyclopropane fatty-acyl-phospholipid synthase-like methyltransferase